MRAELVAISGVLGVLCGSMLVFVLGPARRAAGSDPDGDRGSFLVGRFLVLWFYWLIRPALAGLVAMGVRPLLFNLAGAFLGIVAGALFASGHVHLGGWAILLAGVADIFDGRLARTLGVASPWGSFLDATLDRFAEVAAFVGLAVLYAPSRIGQAVAAAAMGGSLLVSYTRARGEVAGVLCRAGVMQRQERVLLLGFGALFDPAVSGALGRPTGSLLLAVLTLVAVGAVGTAIYRTVWIASRLPRAET